MTRRATAPGRNGRAGRRAVAALLLLALQAGCHAPAGAPGASEPGLLRLAGADDVPTLDPAMGYDDVSWLFELLVFEPLLGYRDDLVPVPALARSMGTGDGGRRIDLEIRADASFSNGRRVVAGDVAYALRRVLDPATRSPGAEFYRGIRGARDFIEHRSPGVAGLAVVDDTHLSIELEEPDPLFAYKLAMPFTAPVPEEVVRALGRDFAHAPVGAGPFRVTEWRPGERLRLERRESPDGATVEASDPTPDDGGVPVRAIEWASGVGEQLGWLRFQSGEVDVLRRLPFEERARIGAGSRVPGRLIRGPQLVTGFLGLDASVPPFDRRAVREAVGHAVDRARLVALTGGLDVPAAGILPPGMPGYRPRPLPSPDLFAARAALRDAGLEDGFATTLWVRNDPPAILEAEAIAQDLVRAGIRVTVKPVTWGALLQAVRVAGLVPMFVMRWQADFPDPSNFLEVLFHSRGIGENNSTFLSDGEVDRALDRAAPLPPGDERWAAYAAIEDRILSLVPRVPLVHPLSLVVVGPRVSGYRLHPMRPERLQDVRLLEAGGVQSAEGSGTSR